MDRLRLGNIPVGPKIFFVVALLLGLSGSIAWMGLSALATTFQAMADNEEMADQMRAAARGTANALSYARSLEALANPISAEARRTAETMADDELKRFTVRLAELKKEVDEPAALKLLDQAEALLAQYAPVDRDVRRLAAEAKFDAARARAAEGADTFTRIREVMSNVEREINKHREAISAMAAANYQATRQWMWVAIGSGIAVAIGLVLSIVVVGLTRPLQRISRVMGVAAEGDLNVEVPYAGRRDEIGTLARALERFITSGREAVRLREEQARLEREAEEAKRRTEAEERERAERDRLAEEQRRRDQEAAERRAAEEKREAEARLKAEAEAERKRQLGTLADSFEAAIGGVVQTVAGAADELNALAQQLVEAAKVTDSSAAAVAAASEEASTNVATVASASEELASSVHEISRQVQASTAASGEAVQQVEESNGQVNQLVQAAEKIGAIVELISSIASQTNLLALNATIEAARAGEAGKGFAVVASEVKSLATQTAKATQEITGQIGAIQSTTQSSAAAIRAIGATIAKVSEIATAIASAVEEQSAATQEIARNVAQASAGTNQVSADIQSVSTVTRKTGEAATRVLSAAGNLSQQSATLKAEVSRFVQTVRAA